MDSVKSFRGYGKVDPAEDQAFRRKTRRRLIVLVVSVIVLLAIVVGAVVGTLANKKSSSANSSAPATPSESLKSVCSVTQYPDSCFSSISSVESSSNATKDPEEIFKLSLLVADNEITKLISLPAQIISEFNISDERVKAALSDCQTLFDYALYHLNDSISSTLSVSNIDDIQTWLSSVITYQETCLDGLREINAMTVEEAMQLSMQNSTEYSSNSLAIVTNIFTILESFNIPIHRRKLLSTLDHQAEFPEWVRVADRRLLQETNPTPNLTVAQDGSGNFKTITEAVAAVPQQNKRRFVIYVKAGTYVEKVNIGVNVWNLMMYGDGMTSTIVSGSLSYGDNSTTFNSASFAVLGKGFIARDMGFENTAGAAKFQAVALRSSSDQSVFYRCAFNAFQDTLYALANRQFYRECDIIGTIDFIFGNAAAVFQSCNIQARQPLSSQYNTLTAQGRSDKNQNTGISIQKSTLSTFDAVTALVYLGRPWKSYSTTVFMESTMGSFINPAGWVEWFYNVTPPGTIFYGEYQNTGPGSSVANRVKWAGVHSSLTTAQATKYTVASFLKGDGWLPATSVQYDSSL